MMCAAYAGPTSHGYNTTQTDKDAFVIRKVSAESSHRRRIEHREARKVDYIFRDLHSIFRTPTCHLEMIFI